MMINDVNVFIACIACILIHNILTQLDSISLSKRICNPQVDWA